MYRTLADFEADLRYQFDIEGFTDRHPVAQVQRLINESVRAMRRLVTEAGSSQYLKRWETTAGPGTTTGYHGFIPSAPGSLFLDSVIDVAAQSSAGEWYRLPELTLQSENVDGNRDTDTRPPAGWILVSYDSELSPSSSGASRQVMIVPPLNGTYNLRITYLPVWTDATGTDHLTIEAGNLEWVKWHVGIKLAERDEDIAALQRRREELAKLQSEMLMRATREGASARSRISARRRSARSW